MADAGIKISQLSNVQNPNISDYTVLVHDGITCRSALSSLQRALNTSIAFDLDKINQIIATAGTINDRIDDLSSKYNSLSNDYLSSYLSTYINEMMHIVFGDDIEGFPSIEERMTDMAATVANVSSAVSVLTEGDTLNNILTLIDLLSNDEGGISLGELANTIDEHGALIDKLNEEVRPMVDETLKSTKINEALVADSIEDYSYTSFTNISNDNVINPLRIEYATNDDGGTVYDFFYDKNRFANIPLVNRMQFNLSGLIPSDDPNADPTTVNFISSSFSGVDGSTEVLSNGITIGSVGIVSANGLSVDTETLNMISVVIAVIDDPDDPDYGSKVLRWTNLEYEGDNTFDSSVGIPLRYGMLKIDDSDEDNARAYVNLNTFGKARVKVFLNRSPFAKNTYKSVLELDVNGKTIVTKNSNIQTVEDSGDLIPIYDGVLPTKSKIDFSIKKILNGSGEEVPLYTVLSAQNLSADKNTLFGMLVPMTMPSQVKNMELGNFKITAIQTSESNTYTIEGQMFFGIQDEEVDISAFYTAQDIEDSNDINKVIEKEYGHKTITVTVRDDFAVQYSIDGLTPNSEMRAYVFAKDPRTGNIFYPGNNGTSFTDIYDFSSDDSGKSGEEGGDSGSGDDIEEPDGGGGEESGSTEDDDSGEPPISENNSEIDGSEPLPDDNIDG